VIVGIVSSAHAATPPSTRAHTSSPLTHPRFTFSVLSVDIENGYQNQFSIVKWILSPRGCAPEFTTGDTGAVEARRVLRFAASGDRKPARPIRRMVLFRIVLLIMIFNFDIDGGP
jgi:hypothetical protein